MNQARRLTEKEAVMSLISPDMKSLNSKENKCPICGENLFTEIEWLGEKVYKPVSCECARKKDENKMADILVKEQRQLLLEKYKTMSIVDKKALNETFDKAVVDNDNREIYQIVKHYCKNFDKAISKNTGLYIFGKRGR